MPAFGNNPDHPLRGRLIRPTRRQHPVRSLVYPCLAVLALALLPGAALAAGGGGGGGGGGGVGGGGGGEGAGRDGGPVSPLYLRGVAAIQAQRWAEAIAVLAPYVKAERNDADGHNWLAYAYRKSGQLTPAFTHYKRALAIDPVHLGAHEYIGEAYLQAGQPERAEYHLRELARICSSLCEQFEDLREAMAQYRSGARPSAKGPGS